MPKATDLPLDESAALGSGASFWKTKTAAGLEAIVLSDGPHGVRAQNAAVDHLGIAPSEPATCFPPAAGLAQSWNTELAAAVGSAIAREARHYGVGVQLGPGINIRRDPRGGRNFEYFSEDPFLSGELGAAWVRAVQEGGVGASVKHFAANNAEHDRMRSDSRIDARTLREIYLRAFERVVRNAAPWTVMASYNRINGTYACENSWLLTEVLRGEWGFDGVVVSDWGAVDDRVASVAAGLDLEMPGSGGGSDEAVVAAVNTGVLDRADVDAAAQNVLTLLERVADGAERQPAGEIDFARNHEVAREAARGSIVLLKNDGDLLPLSSSGQIAVIGAFAQTPRYQGGGSSHVNATRVDIPLDEIRALAPEATVTYSVGFGAEASSDLTQDAVEAAAASDVAVVFLGLADHEESEGADRVDIDLPAAQIELLRAVVDAQPNTVVVLSHGGVVQLTEVAALSPAILDGALLGQAGGGAIADTLFGLSNPSGRLSETSPVRLKDTPAYLSFPGEESTVRYAEGLFVGYRWYDARDIAVTYPFGHGLSYTTFDYTNAAVSVDAEGLHVHVTVRNTGARDGREVVQVYVGKPDSAVTRAIRELRGFANVFIAAGEEKDVVIDIPRSDLAYWSEPLNRWIVEGGQYVIELGASSRDIRHSLIADLVGDEVRAPLTPHSTFGEVMADPIAGPLIASLSPQRDNDSVNSESLGIDVGAMMAQIPLSRMVAFSGGAMTPEHIQGILTLANDTAAKD